MIVKDFDKKSDTVKWLFCKMLSATDDDLESLDVAVLINGKELDINEFVDYVADAMDETIDYRAVKKLDDAMMSFSNDIYEIQVETRLKLCELLGVNPEFS